MKRSSLLHRLLAAAVVLCCATPFPAGAGADETGTAGAAAAASARLAELDRFWDAVSKSVREGDFEAYKAACHADSVLVSEEGGTSYPMAKAFERWKPGFDDTKAGRARAGVEFRFSRRLGDATTAHETGIFLYSFTDAQRQAKKDYVRFEALLIKRDGGWKILMEYQKSAATAEDWAALQPAGGKK